jgi:multidrug efflux pump subunit AcrA (membrane-fusion protein)
MNPIAKSNFHPARFLLAMLGALALFVFVGNAAESKQLYTCGMHPSVIQDHPGNCPICGMKLTPIKNGAGADAAGNSSAIAVDAATQQNMNLRTAEVIRGALRKTIRTVGAIDYNETALADVTTKFKGWVEKLNVDATGQLVHRGEPMFEIYSPELYNAQSEFLLALNSGTTTNDPGAAFLRESALNKLKFFDVPEAQIAALEKTRKLTKTLPVVAPLSGFVIEKNVVAGQMVDAGMKLYRIADLGIVWVIAQVYEQDLPFVKLGQEAVVKVASLPDREFRGRVTFVYPSVDEKTRTAKVRLEFENPGYFLKPGMFVSALIHAQLDDSAVLVPESAVLRSGARNTVFVALDGGKFEGRDVTLGVEAENAMIQITSGLSAGERVVTSGQFLLDSESQLREAIEKMRGSGVAASRQSAANSGGAEPRRSAETPLPPTAESSVYVCPMPEHVSIIYDHPGKCPICDMALVSITHSALEKIQPGGKVLFYTCPMPEHAAVHEAKPGKCPLCAMTLIPAMELKAAAKVELPLLYTCPMKSDADVVSDQPGKCPKCEMELVPTSTVKHSKLAEENWLKQHAH